MVPGSEPSVRCWSRSLESVRPIAIHGDFRLLLGVGGLQLPVGASFRYGPMEIHSVSVPMPAGLSQPLRAAGLGAGAVEGRPPELEGASREPAPAEEADELEEGEKGEGSAKVGGAEAELSEEEQRELQLLKERDAEVRAHEQAHVAAGGRYVTSQASYDYQIGPDGRRYAVGGEVGIDTSEVSGDPAATIEKARTLIRAALAPADPSAQDYRVASSARAMETEALRELVELQQEETREAGVGEAAEVDRNDGQEANPPPAASSARERLEQRIQGFFVGGPAGSLSHFA